MRLHVGLFPFTLLKARNINTIRNIEKAPYHNFPPQTPFRKNETPQEFHETPQEKILTPIHSYSNGVSSAMKCCHVKIMIHNILSKFSNLPLQTSRIRQRLYIPFHEIPIRITSIFANKTCVIRKWDTQLSMRIPVC